MFHILQLKFKDAIVNGLTSFSVSNLQKIYIALAVANSIVTLARAFSFAYGGMRAASRVHTAFIQKVITAPVKFFDQNPSGRILNRCADPIQFANCNNFCTLQ